MFTITEETVTERAEELVITMMSHAYCKPGSTTNVDNNNNERQLEDHSTMSNGSRVGLQGFS